MAAYCFWKAEQGFIEYEKAALVEIDLLKNSNEHVDWVVNRRNFGAQWDKFTGLLLGENCRKTVN